MLDFNNLHFFPSLFEDLSYIIINDTKLHFKNFPLNLYPNNTNTSPFIDTTVTLHSPNVAGLISDPNNANTFPFKDTTATLHSPNVAGLISDSTNHVNYQVTPYTESYSINTSPKSSTSDSTSSTFSKYFYYQDQTPTSTTLNKHNSPEDKLGYTSPLQAELPIDYKQLRNAPKKVVRFENTELYSSFKLDPEAEVADVTANTKPVEPDFHHSPLAQTENISSLHKLNTDIGTYVNPTSLHDELFKKKVIFEEKNNLLSQLEISNINLEFKVTKIHQESSNLVKQKLELTKQFNINNIKDVDHIPSSIRDKYKNAYLSITNINHDITTSIHNIKNKLDFMENTKINLLKEINDNTKSISNLKYNQTLLAKEIHDIEKITGNIARTPLK